MGLPERIYDQPFIEAVANDLQDRLTLVAGLHRLPSEAYVLASIYDGQQVIVCTRPFALHKISESEGVSLESLGDIGILRPHVGLTEHLSAVLQSHPDVAFVCDHVTLVHIQDEVIPENIEDLGDHHYSLTLNSGTVQLFVGYTAIKYSSTQGINGIDS